MKLKIAERFSSIQGEGALTGTPMEFIRFAGCGVSECALHPVNDGYCDTDWGVSDTVDGVKGVESLAESLSDAEWVCVTGGEPFNQLMQLKVLTSALRKRGVKVNIQTSGMVAGVVPCDWLAVSPKCEKPTDLVQRVGDELKVVWHNRDYGQLSGFYNFTNFQSYWIQPLTIRTTPNTASAIEAVGKANRMGMSYRLSTQTHKLWGVR